MNDRLNFILTVIKRYYNSNDRSKLILLFIRWENGLKNRLKLVKNERKENRKWRWKLQKQEMNWKSWIRKLTRWRTKNGWRTVKNDEKPSRICSQKRLGSITNAPRLEFSSPKTAEMHSQRGIRDPWNNPFLPFIGKKGEEFAAQLAQASWIASYFENTLECPNSKFWKLLFAPPILISSPLSFVIYRKVTEAIFLTKWGKWLPPSSPRRARLLPP